MRHSSTWQYIEDGSACAQSVPSQVTEPARTHHTTVKPQKGTLHFYRRAYIPNIYQNEDVNELSAPLEHVIHILNTAMNINISQDTIYFQYQVYCNRLRLHVPSSTLALLLLLFAACTSSVRWSLVRIKNFYFDCLLNQEQMYMPLYSYINGCVFFYSLHDVELSFTGQRRSRIWSGAGLGFGLHFELATKQYASAQLLCPPFFFLSSHDIGDQSLILCAYLQNSHVTLEKLRFLVSSFCSWFNSFGDLSWLAMLSSVDIVVLPLSLSSTCRVFWSTG